MTGLKKLNKNRQRRAHLLLTNKTKYMNLKKAIQALKDHAQEEIRIHQEIMEEAGGDVKHLAEKHLADTIEIHKRFWKDLKKSWKDK